MTNTTFESAKNLARDIETLEKSVNALSASLDRSKSWLMKLSNRLKSNSKSGCVEASVILLDGLDRYGIDLEVDNEVVRILKEYFEKQLAEKRKEFEEL